MVKFIENELSSLREEVVQMWNLVYSQLQHAKTAVINLDRKAAQQIAVRERRVALYPSRCRFAFRVGYSENQ